MFDISAKNCFFFQSDSYDDNFEISEFLYVIKINNMIVFYPCIQFIPYILRLL